MGSCIETTRKEKMMERRRREEGCADAAGRKPRWETTLPRIVVRVTPNWCTLEIADPVPIQSVETNEAI